MSLWYRTKVIFVVSFVCILCDQLTKWWASHYLTLHKTDSYLNDMLRIVYSENTGAFLGLGKNLPEQLRFFIFVAMVGIMLLAMLVYMLKSQQQGPSSLVALALIFSGGISNFYDRAVNDGAVIDFLNVGIGSLRTGIFNVADMAIMLGVLLVLFSGKSSSRAVRAQ